MLDEEERSLDRDNPSRRGYQKFKFNDNVELIFYDWIFDGMKLEEGLVGIYNIQTKSYYVNSKYADLSIDSRNLIVQFVGSNGIGKLLEDVKQSIVEYVLCNLKELRKSSSKRIPRYIYQNEEDTVIKKFIKDEMAEDRSELLLDAITRVIDIYEFFILCLYQNNPTANTISDRNDTVNSITNLIFDNEYMKMALCDYADIAHASANKAKKILENPGANEKLYVCRKIYKALSIPYVNVTLKVSRNGNHMKYRYPREYLEMCVLEFDTVNLSIHKESNEINEFLRINSKNYKLPAVLNFEDISEITYRNKVLYRKEASSVHTNEVIKKKKDHER